MLAFALAIVLSSQPSALSSSPDWRCTEPRPLVQGSGTVRTCEAVRR